jgi:hypothetical protein
MDLEKYSKSDICFHAYKWGSGSLEYKLHLFKHYKDFQAFYVALDTRNTDWEFISYLQKTSRYLTAAALEHIEDGSIELHLRSLKVCDCLEILQLLGKSRAITILENFSADKRIKILQKIKRKGSVLNLITESQKKIWEEKRSEGAVQERVFIATKNFLSLLDEPARKCYYCENDYTEGDDFSFSRCAKHTKHARQCWARGNGLCGCHESGKREEMP